MYTPQEIANAFNQFFHSTLSTSSGFFLPNTADLPTPSSQIGTIDITGMDVLTSLCTLDETKAFGTDQIHAKILKKCATSLVDVIHNLLVMCLSKSQIPAEWKIPKITPIPKKGRPTGYI